MPSDNFETKHILPVGLWSWDVQRDIAFTDQVASQYFNVTEREGMEGRPLARLLTAVHPDDRNRVDQGIRHALGGAPYRLRYRVFSRALGERTILASGRCFFNPDGKPNLYPGFVVDVSENTGTALQRLAGHLSASQVLAGTIGDPAISYLLEATQLEVNELLAKRSDSLN